MSSKYRESRRRCLLCGCSPCMDPNISVFRFPKPGKKNTQRCEQWAHYCFPEREWFSPVFQQQLYSEHKVLCSKHFRKTSFIDYPTSFKSLHRFAVPENEIVVTCEICGITTKEVLNQERLFMAQFPLNEDCCRQWVRLTGKKDLAYVPIEELHSSKNICGQHFRPEDFVKKDILLRKNAVPSIGLTAEPLSEEILKDFPLHIAITTAGKENNPQCVNIDCDENGSSSANISQTGPSPEPLVEDNAPSLTEDTLETEDDHTNDDIETKEKETFSWQKANQICLDDEDEMFENTVATESKTNVGLDLKYWKSEEKKSDKEHINHKEYICNNCCKSIDGFRYTCVSCENYDLCRDCETDMTHPEHCMLRIPEPRPKGEIQSILEAIREKMRSISEELGQNMIALDEVKVEVDFDVPTAIDPLTSPQSGAQLEAADVICDILKSDVTSPDETTNEATSDKITEKSSVKAPSVARQKAMSHSKPKERRSDTSLQPQTVRATKTPINRPKKLKLTTDFDGNNSKGPLKRIKLEKNQDFDQESLNPGHLEIKLENKDLEQESLNPKVHMKRIKLSRQVEENFEQECLEETWLDEDILKEENKLFDVSETSVSHTRSSAQPGPS